MHFAFSMLDSPERQNKRQHPNSLASFKAAQAQWKQALRQALNLSPQEVQEVSITFHGVNLLTGLADFKGQAPPEVVAKINGKLI